MAFAQGLPLRAEESFGLERFTRRKNEPYSQDDRSCSQTIPDSSRVSLRDMVGYSRPLVRSLRAAWNCGVCTMEHRTPYTYLRNDPQQSP